VKSKIAILHGQIFEDSNWDEQDVLVQVQAISQSLLRLGFEPIAIPLLLNLKDTAESLRKIRPTIVFNIVESVEGQGRLIHLGTALLDFLKIPYTGARTEAMFLTSNKLLGKTMFRSGRIPTADWFTRQNLTQDVSIRPGRYIVKSVWEHASVGLSEASIIDATSVEDLRTALEQRQHHIGGEGFVEAFIDGREFNLSMLAGNNGPEVLPPAEICFDKYPVEKLKIVDYRAKWDEKSFEYEHTLRRYDFQASDQPLMEQLKMFAAKCWDLFELRGYARVDFRVDQTGVPYALEVNTNPCLSPDAGFFAAAQQAGLTYDQVIERILKDVK
jgi:D-alanine-D-alanine ligase